MTKRQKKIFFENRHLGRRQFLMGLGSTTLCLPALVSLMPSRVAASVLDQKKVRAVVYMGTLGIMDNLLYPTTTDGMVPVPGLYQVLRRDLSSFTGNVSYAIDDKYKPIFPYMNLMRGLSMCGGAMQDHNISILAGQHSQRRTPDRGTTIDVIMAKSSGVYAPTEAVPHRILSITNAPEMLAFSYDFQGGTKISSGGIQGDRNLFNTLFGKWPVATGGAQPVPTGPTSDQKSEKLVVDQVLGDLKSLTSSKRLSKDDSLILDHYITSMNELQKRVIANQAPVPVNLPSMCKAQPGIALQAIVGDEKNRQNQFLFPQDPAWGVTNAGVMYDNINEMIKLAFACDLTRVVYIGNSNWSDAPMHANSLGGIHHDCPGATVSADRQNWGLKKMASLAVKLRDTVDPQGSGNLLDNSIILCTNELGDWSTNHRVTSMPAITFGKAGGKINTGHYMDFLQRPFPTNVYLPIPGRPFKQLLQSVMYSMGVTEAEYSKYGIGGFGEFIEGINQNNKIVPNAYTPYKNEHNKPLPFITNA